MAEFINDPPAQETSLASGATRAAAPLPESESGLAAAAELLLRLCTRVVRRTAMPVSASTPSVHAAYPAAAPIPITSPFKLPPVLRLATAAAAKAAN